MDRIAVRLLIRGRVQGVGYRWWARDRALRLNVDGWVRNRSDGSVELLAVGPAPDVEQLSDLCWRGPAAARVMSVERFEADPQACTGFQARATV
jgi:acylphosphatase